MSGGARIGEIMGRAYCPHRDAELAKSQTANGTWQLFMWCDACRNNVSKEKGFRGVWIAKDDPRIAHIAPNSIRVISLEQVYRLCDGPCGRVTHCELHHWGPRRNFGLEADNWPMGWLCRPCHEIWHAKMGQPIGPPTKARGAA